MDLIFWVVLYRPLSILFCIMFPNILQNADKCQFLFFLSFHRIMGFYFIHYLLSADNLVDNIIKGLSV